MLASKVVFDYNTFFNYWVAFTDNCKSSTSCYFYLHGMRSQQKPQKKYLPATHTNISGVRVFVQSIGNKQLIFTIPVLLDGKLWDFHYHTGLNDDFVDKITKKKQPAVFFHKTLQHPKGYNPLDKESEGKEHKNCYFYDGDTITSVERIVCRNMSQGKTLKDVFPNELHIIQEIITRPFLMKSNLKGGSKYKWLFGRWRKVYDKNSILYIKYKKQILPIT